MNPKERYEKASAALREAIKGMHPLANIATQHRDGSYMIPEYKEYLDAHLQYAYSKPSDEELSRWYEGMINAECFYKETY